MNRSRESKSEPEIESLRATNPCLADSPKIKFTLNWNLQ
jgi:hypothetical protein